eukprot:41668-Chlamydomonas_euryale.AAC.2
MLPHPGHTACPFHACVGLHPPPPTVRNTQNDLMSAANMCPSPPQASSGTQIERTLFNACSACSACDRAQSH